MVQDLCVTESLTLNTLAATYPSRFSPGLSNAGDIASNSLRPFVAIVLCVRMESILLSPGALLTFLAIIATLILTFSGSFRWNSNSNAREPPYIYSHIPFIGHVVGMLRHGAKYFEIVKYANTTETVGRRSS